MTHKAFSELVERYTAAFIRRKVSAAGGDRRRRP